MHEAVLLITRPGGGRSFDYGDHWDNGDLIYTGKGLTGDQVLKGANRDVAEGRRRLLLFESAGARQLEYMGQVVCTDYWETTAPDREGSERKIFRFRLRPASPSVRAKDRTGDATQRGGRAAASFPSRPFDPDRPAPARSAASVGDPEQRRVLVEQASSTHQAILKALGLWLQSEGWTDLEEVDGATDLMGVRPMPRCEGA